MSASSTARVKHARLARRSPRRSRDYIISRRPDSPLHFLGAFVRKPFTVGAVWPSSPALSRVVVDGCEIRPGGTIVELGPGTGPFTELILQRLNGGGRFFAVEINPTNARVLRRRFPRCEVIQDSAENLPRHLGSQRADCIVSGLAWASMLPRTQNRIFRAVLTSLAPGGQFVAFAYLHAAWLPTSMRFRLRLRRHFDRVETTPVVWRNLPPAFVYRCWRA
jgi:phosphatidylethanolamine/phosphatidyl-N-methylethanolamine N-methyltransferase